MRHFYFTLLLLLCSGFLYSQPKVSDDYIAWSATRKLTANDFIIKTKDLQSNTSFAQFYMDYQVGGFSFMANNFNKKVGNYFIKSGSWMDTTYNVSKSIRCQQTLFDIAEIYARQFRKELKANKRKILGGTNFIKEINDKIVSDMAKRRIDYDTETKFGSDAAKQAEWENEIWIELKGLKEFGRE